MAKDEFSYVEKQYVAQNSLSEQIKMRRKKLGLMPEDIKSEEVNPSDPKEAREKQKEESEGVVEFVEKMAYDAREMSLPGTLAQSLGGVLDFAQGASNAVIDLANGTEDFLAKHGVGSGDLIDGGGDIDIVDKFIPPSDNMYESMLRVGVQYMLPYMGLGKIVKSASPLVKTSAQVVGSGAIVAAAADPNDKRLADFAQSNPYISALIPEYLVSDPNDTNAESRFKNALEDMYVTGVAGFGGLLFKAMKAGKNAKKFKEVEGVLTENRSQIDQAINSRKQEIDAMEGSTQGVAVKEGDIPKAIEPDDPFQRMDEQVLQEEIDSFRNDFQGKYLAEDARPDLAYLNKVKKSQSAQDLIKAKGGEPLNFQELSYIAKRGIVTQEAADNAAKSILKDSAKTDEILRREMGKGLNKEQTTAIVEKYKADYTHLIATINSVQDVENMTRAEILAVIDADNVLKSTTLNMNSSASELGRGLEGHKVAMDRLGEDAKKMKYVAHTEMLHGGKDAVEKYVRQVKNISNKETATNAMIMASKKNSLLEKADVIVDYYRANLLSSLGTQATALFGNSTYAVENTIAKFIERGIDIGSGRNQMAGEITAHLKGIMSGMYAGLKDTGAFLIGRGPKPDTGFKFKQHTPMINAQRFGLQGSESGFGLAEATNMVGNFISPVSKLQAQDSFFRALSKQKTLNELAIREARGMGLVPGTQKYKDQVNDILLNPPQHIYDEMEREASRAAFAAPYSDVPMIGSNRSFGDTKYKMNLGSLLELSEDVINEVPLLRLFAPFIRITANVSNYAIERSPFINRLSPKMRADMAAGGARRTKAQAKIAYGTGLMSLGAYMNYQGVLTGSQPGARYLDENITGDARYREHVILREDGSTIKVDRLEPAGMLLSMGADIAEMVSYIPEARSGEFAKLIATAGAIISDNYAPSFLTDSVGRFLQALDDPNRGSFPISSSGLIPAGAFLKEVRKEVDPQRRLTDKPIEFTEQEKKQMSETTRAILTSWEEMKAEFMNTIPGLSGKLPSDRNIFGEPVLYPTGIGGEVASAVFSNDERRYDSPLYKEIFRLGMSGPIFSPKQEPGVGKFILSKPGRIIDLAGFTSGSTRQTLNTLKQGGASSTFTYELTDEEYDKYLQLTAGVGLEGVPTLKSVMEGIVKSSEYKQANDEMKKIMLYGVVGQYRRKAKKAIVNEIPQFSDKIEQKARVRQNMLLRGNN